MNRASSSPDRHVPRGHMPMTLVLALATLPSTALAQLETPASWRWTTDRAAQMVTGEAVHDSAWHFVAMPPGWHITTGPGATLYEPTHRADGRFRVESELILFPGESQSGYGVFIGGRDLEGGSAEYLALLIRRDGQAAVELRRGGVTRLVQPWAPNTAVKPYPGRDVGTNVLGIAAVGDSLVFSANGERVFAMARGDLPVDGLFGFRIGGDVNLHITTLDITRRLAPPRSR